MVSTYDPFLGYDGSDGDEPIKGVKEALPPIPPGEVLGERFMLPANIGPTALARSLFVPVNRVTDILCGKRRITARTALIFGEYFRTTPEFWMRLQMDYDLREAQLNRFTRTHLQSIRRLRAH